MQKKTKELLKTHKKLSNIKHDKTILINELKNEIKPLFNIEKHEKILKLLINEMQENSLIIELKTIGAVTEKQLNKTKELLGFKEYVLETYESKITIKYYNPGVD